MARNGIGQYIPPSNSFNPAVALTQIQSTAWNAILADLSAALTQSVSSDGQTTTSARIPLLFGVSVGAGLGVNFLGSSSTGLYSPATDQVGLAAGGVLVLTASATALTSTKPITAPGFNGPLTGNGSGTWTGPVNGNVTGNLTGNVTGNVSGSAGAAATAATWTTARTLSYTGDVTGTGSVDGSANVAFALTIPANTVTNAKAAQMAAGTVKANLTGATANASDVTTAALLAALGFDFTNIASGEIKLGSLYVKTGRVGPFTVDSQGTVTFTNAFPNGVMPGGVKLTPELNGVYATNSDSWVVLDQNSFTTTGFTFHIASSANNQQLYVNWESKGY